MTQGSTERDKQRRKLVDEAKTILRGRKKTPAECLALAEQLKDHNEMRWARRLLDMTTEQLVGDLKLRQEIAQMRALVTYKDAQLGRDEALDKALAVLSETFDLSTTTDQETLGLAGAIYKRKWEVDADKLQLERALMYVRRGFEVGIAKDDGYTAINAAFLQDLLAHIEICQALAANVDSVTAEQRRADAQTIREKIVEVLSPKFAALDEAKLAELDLLRHVEVLSCVSGGSIVGAHYYLELRRLLHKT